MNNQYPTSLRDYVQGSSIALSGGLLFLVWPFGAFLLAIKDYQKPYARHIVWLFTIYLGYTFVIGNNMIDANRTVDDFIVWHNARYSFSEFFTYLWTNIDRLKDFYLPVVNYTVSRFTGDSQILFATLGLAYGFFYSNNIWYVIDRIKGGYKIPLIILLYIFIFSLLFPLWRGINGPRFAIASMVFFYGAIRYLAEGKVKGLIIAASSILFHFSAITLIGVLLAYLVGRNRLAIFFILFVITLFIKELDFSYVRNLLSFASGPYESAITNYVNEEYLAHRINEMSGLNWYAYYNHKVFTWTINVIVISLYTFGRKDIRNDQVLLNVFCFSLLLLSVSNITSLIPSGSRFLTVAHLFIIAFYIWYLSYKPVKEIFRTLNIMAIPGLFLYIMVTIRVWFDTLGPITLIGNPLVALFVKDQSLVLDLIK